MLPPKSPPPAPPNCSLELQPNPSRIGPRFRSQAITVLPNPDMPALAINLQSFPRSNESTTSIIARSNRSPVLSILPALGPHVPIQIIPTPQDPKISPCRYQMTLAYVVAHPRGRPSKKRSPPRSQRRLECPWSFRPRLPSSLAPPPPGRAAPRQSPGQSSRQRPARECPLDP